MPNHRTASCSSMFRASSEMSQRTLIDNVLHGFWFLVPQSCSSDWWLGLTGQVWLHIVLSGISLALTSVDEKSRSQEDRSMAQLWESGSQDQLLPTHHSMLDWLSYPLAAGPVRQVFSVTGGLLDAVWCPCWVVTCHSLGLKSAAWQWPPVVWDVVVVVVLCC